MVKEDFRTLGLTDFGVKIDIDDLSKEEIINYIESENFNLPKYLKNDYINFKNYLKCESYPRHSDFLNSDYAPNLLKFMKIKYNENSKGRKTGSYYMFLKKIVAEENLPVFSEEQILAINYLSSLLPLVRKHEYLLMQKLLQGTTSRDEIVMFIKDNVSGCSEESIMPSGSWEKDKF